MKDQLFTFLAELAGEETTKEFMKDPTQGLFDILNHLFVMLDKIKSTDKVFSEECEVLTGFFKEVEVIKEQVKYYKGEMGR